MKRTIERSLIVIRKLLATAYLSRYVQPSGAAVIGFKKRYRMKTFRDDQPSSKPI